MSSLNPNQIRGYKATLANEHVSQKAKDHARQVLQEYEAQHSQPGNADYEPKRDQMKEQAPSHPQVGGRGGGIQDEDFEDVDNSELANDAFYEDEEVEYEVTETASGGTQHSHRVLGGYKATLKNPNASDKAKHHAQDVLGDAGIED